MTFQFKDVLNAIGPTAGLIFAAWIFLSFLQTRYSESYERYRALINEYRNYKNDTRSDPHQASVASQILLYKRRCGQMRAATNIGVVAAMFLILTIILGVFQVVLPQMTWIKYIGLLSSLFGLILLIAASRFVLLENTLIQKAIDDEVSDLQNLEEASQKHESKRISKRSA
jgi:hypothetical protein